MPDLQTPVGEKEYHSSVWMSRLSMDMHALRQMRTHRAFQKSWVWCARLLTPLECGLGGEMRQEREGTKPDKPANLSRPAGVQVPPPPTSTAAPGTKDRDQYDHWLVYRSLPNGGMEIEGYADRRSAELAGARAGWKFHPIPVKVRLVPTPEI